MTMSQGTAGPLALPLKKPRYAVLVALALLSVAIVIVILSATHPVSSDDLGVLPAFPRKTVTGLYQNRTGDTDRSEQAAAGARKQAQ